VLSKKVQRQQAYCSYRYHNPHAVLIHSAYALHLPSQRILFVSLSSVSSPRSRSYGSFSILPSAVEQAQTPQCSKSVFTLIGHACWHLVLPFARCPPSQLSLFPCYHTRARRTLKGLKCYAGTGQRRYDQGLVSRWTRDPEFLH
jgi:hypothetical protein